MFFFSIDHQNLDMADSLGYEYTLSKQSTGEADGAAAAPTAWAAIDAAAAVPAAWFDEVKGWFNELTEDKQKTIVNDAVKDAVSPSRTLLPPFPLLL